jgi:Xaa-Pro aminopeptidase
MKLEQLRQTIVEKELDGMLITDPLNRRYLSAFSGSAGTLLVTPERAMLAIDFRYYERAEREAPDWEQVHVTNTHPETVAQMVAQAGVVKLGIEADHVTVAQLQEMEKNMPAVTLVPLEGVVRPLRAKKTAEEVAAIREAIAYADDAFAHLCQVLRPGMTERQVAWELESHMRVRGADGASFPFIVGSGPNGAMPHATAGDRVVQAGEPIVMDFGALVRGYCSDITRTLCLGTASERYLQVWHQVLEAQLAVERGLRPGMTGQQADAIARDLFTQAGVGERFGHGLGHGVGLAIHETPFMGRLSKDVILEPGMVITVEPGLYFPGWGGVRIEDIILLGDDGAEVLTGAPKEPVLAVRG